MSAEPRFPVTYWTTTGTREPAAVRSVTLDDLIEDAVTTTRAIKTDLPLIKLATYGATPNVKGSLRWAGNITAISGVELDYDSEVMPLRDAVAKLNAAKILFGAYTSFSHTACRPRWRIICPLSENLSVSQRAQLVARVNGVLGGVLAAESFVDAQCYYLGHRDGATDDEFYVSRAGRFIDRCDDLNAGAIGLPPLTPREARIDELARVPSTDAALEVLRLGVEEIGASVMGEKYHTVKRVTWSLAAWVNADLLDHDDAQAAVYAAADLAGAARMEPVHALWEGAIAKRDPLEIHDGSELGPLPDETSDEIIARRGGRRMRLASELKLEASQPYIVKGLIRRGDVGIILGAPGAGKSMIAPLLGYKIALGMDVFGMRSKQGRVLYAAAEDAHGMDHRVMALRSEYGTTDDFAVVTIENLGDTVESDALLADVRNWKPTLVVIDTLAAAWAGMVENDSADMGKVVEFARRIAATGAGVVLVHHPAKNSDGSPRGHSSLNGTADWTLLLGERTDDGIARCKVTKNRAGRSDLDIAFSQRSVTLGRDEDGEPITAPMAVELPARPFAERKPVKALPPSLAFALGVLTDMIDAAGGQPASVELWRNACLNDGAWGGDGNSFRARFSTAKRDLIARKIIAVDGNGLASLVKRPFSGLLRNDKATIPLDALQQ